MPTSIASYAQKQHFEFAPLRTQSTMPRAPQRWEEAVAECLEYFNSHCRRPSLTGGAAEKYVAKWCQNNSIRLQKGVLSEDRAERAKIIISMSTKNSPLWSQVYEESRAHVAALGCLPAPNGSDGRSAALSVWCRHHLLAFRRGMLKGAKALKIAELEKMLQLEKRRRK